MTGVQTCALPISAFNEALNDAPQLLNEKPYDTWIFKLKSGAALDGLLDATGYQAALDAAQ